MRGGVITMLHRYNYLVVFVVLIFTGCATVAPTVKPSNVLPELGQFYGVHFTTNSQTIPSTPWGIQYKPINNTDQPRFNQYLDIFSQEFSKMPVELLRLANLKSVIFVKDMSISGQARTALPDYYNDVLYFDINIAFSHARRVIHHEFYHMLEEELFGSTYYKDPSWAKLNYDDFSYGKGGAFSRDKNLSVYSHPDKGFINGYAMSGLEEDKAEIWSLLWLDYNWQQVAPMLKSDCVIIAKINQLITQMAERSKALSISFWQARFNPYLLKAACE